MADMALLTEAYSRGLLPPDQASAFEELMRRQTVPKQEEPTDWLRVAAQTAGGMAGGALSAPTGPIGAAVGTGLGAGMGGELYDRAKEYFTGRPDPRSMTQHVADAAGDVALNTVAGPMFDAAGGLLSSMVKPVRNAMTGSTAKETLTAMQDLGVTPTAGAVSGSRAVQAVENGVRQLFGGSGIMQPVIQRQSKDIANAAENVASKFGPVQASDTEMGARLKEFAKNAVGRFKERSSGLYDAVGSYFSPEESVAVGNTLGFLKGQQDAYAMAPQLGERFNKGVNDIASRLVADAGESGTIPFQALQRLRTDVGAKLGDAVNAVDDMGRGQLKQLYSALSDDLAANAEAAGPEAKRAFDLANRYYSLQMQKNGNIDALERIISKGLDKQAFDAAMTNKGAYLPQLKQNFQHGEWDELAGTVLGRMGRATPGKQDIAGEVFSPSTFLKNWNSITTEAKESLFGGTRYAQLQPQLDRLLKVVGALKDTEAMANTSGTGVATGVQMLLGGLGAGMTGNLPAAGTAIGATILAPNVAARLLTSPRFVQWLADGAQLSAGGAYDVGKQLTRLGIIAKFEPALESDINAFIDAAGLGPDKKQSRMEGK